MTYLSAQIPRWYPTNEHDLERAAADGLLEETHFVDLKRELSGKQSANKELARDLASFAIDGGALIIGLDEGPAGQAPTLAPVVLRGLPERVEQIARTIPDPPLPVACRVIVSRAEPTEGFLIVNVPVSGTAPHMVDHVYFGRGDKSKIRLSNDEVLRLHAARKATEESILATLDDYVRRDPIPVPERQQAHFLVVAAPVVPRAEMLIEAVSGDEWWDKFRSLLAASYWPSFMRSGQILSPDLGSAGNIGRRFDGAAMTYKLSPERERANGADDSEDAFEVEMSEDGVVRILTTRLSARQQSPGRAQLIIAPTLPILTRRAVQIAGAVGDFAGYLGPWMFGVAATGIGGLAAKGGALDNVRPLPREMAEYRRVTTASLAEMQQTPGAVTQRLVGRLIRALGKELELTPFMTDQPPST